MTTPITITLNDSHRCYNPMFVKGQLIRIAKKKRVWGQVKDDSQSTAYGIKVTLNSVYRPAPKSKLLNKSVFSKVKSKIIPLTKSK